MPSSAGSAAEPRRRWSRRSRRSRLLRSRAAPVPPTPVPVAAVSVAAVFPALGPVIPGVRDVVALFALVPVLRKVRAGDDGELGGGSGISQANAAGETVGVSVTGGENPEDPEIPVRPGRRAGRAWWGGPREWRLLRRRGLRPGRRSPRGQPRTAFPWPGRRRGVSLPGVSLAGVSLAAAVPLALRSDTSPLAGAVVTGAVPAAAFRDVRLGGAAMMPVAWVTSLSSTSSPVREVTMVGEAPPEPSGPLVRLSKPSSLCPDPHEVIPGRDAHMTTCAKKTAVLPDSACPMGRFCPRNGCADLLSR